MDVPSVGSLVSLDVPGHCLWPALPEIVDALLLGQRNLVPLLSCRVLEIVEIVLLHLFILADGFSLLGSLIFM